MSDTDGRLGVRGGTTDSLAEAQQLQGDFKAQEAERIRRMILLVAADLGEFHADHAASWEVSEPNVIGAQVNALARMGLLEKRNRAGEVEHRKASATASHGRASYVWRLSAKGRSFLNDTLPASGGIVRPSPPAQSEAGSAPMTEPLEGLRPEPTRARSYGDPEDDDA